MKLSRKIEKLQRGIDRRIQTTSRAVKKISPHQDDEMVGPANRRARIWDEMNQGIPPTRKRRSLRR